MDRLWKFKITGLVVITRQSWMEVSGHKISVSPVKSSCHLYICTAFFS